MRASVLASSVNIYKAMGGGWVSEADKLTTGGTIVPVTERMDRQPVF